MTVRPDPSGDFDSMLDSVEDPEGYTCWCGAELTDEDVQRMNDDLDGPPCGGSGMLHCYCGGDFCCCHNHGESECPGCPDCDGGDDFNPYEDMDWDQENLWPRC